MDNNKQSLAADATNPVSQPQPATPLPQTPSVSSPQMEGDNKQMIFLLIGGMAIIILVVGGIYWYFSKQGAQPAPEAETSTPAVTQNKEDLEGDINAVEVNDADFTEVDKDLQNL